MVSSACKSLTFKRISDNLTLLELFWPGYQTLLYYQASRATKSDYRIVWYNANCLKCSHLCSGVFTTFLLVFVFCFRKQTILKISDSQWAKTSILIGFYFYLEIGGAIKSLWSLAKYFHNCEVTWNVFFRKWNKHFNTSSLTDYWSK